MDIALQVWLVHRNRDDFKNVIVTAANREAAKRMAQGILLDDPEEYIVTPVTELGSSTIFILTTPDFIKTEQALNIPTFRYP